VQDGRRLVSGSLQEGCAQPLLAEVRAARNPRL